MINVKIQQKDARLLRHLMEICKKFALFPSKYESHLPYC